MATGHGSRQVLWKCAEDSSSEEALDTGAHQMHSTGAHQMRLDLTVRRGPGQSGPRDPDPWSTGGLKPKGDVSIGLTREHAPEGDQHVNQLRSALRRLPPLLVSYEQG
ncbi:hypothetical protein GCM10012287_16670 [Streptomyces daqingensis]|uniref:Uncharacterized protein n=1 Tax=Streptomyces daqingensis TaxID=1472640 RepID=A0ABQ2M337_9ACTN|nr:hypothetical protein GCM10012287_16670 [Streptomyces daqingensis]